LGLDEELGFGVRARVGAKKSARRRVAVGGREFVPTRTGVRRRVGVKGGEDWGQEIRSEKGSGWG